MPTPDVVAKLIIEATSTEPFPLPMASHWNSSANSNYWGWTPTYWVEALAEGHHVMPVVYGPTQADTNTWWTTNFNDDLDLLGTYNVPITVQHTQWEALLYNGSEPWFGLPNADNPCVIDKDTDVPLARVCPIGATNNRTTPWTECGTRWATGAMMTALQAALPTPALVLHLLNNEANRQEWHDIETINDRYFALYGAGQTDNFKRTKIRDGYPSLYTAMFNAFRTGQSTAHWRDNSKIIGYNSDSKPYLIMGRSATWANPAYFTTTPQQWHWARECFEGDSSSCYHTGENSDATVTSLGVGLSGGLFAIDQVKAAVPAWWYEISYWDGNDYPTSADDWRLTFTAGVPHVIGNWTPERSAACVQFMMWLSRPRVVREFRGAGEKKAASVTYWEAMLACVDRVWNDGTLAAFWRNSTLVENTARAHPYTTSVPTEYSAVPRWFLLSTNVDVGGTWTLTTEVKVFALARVNAAGEYLVYCYSPREDRTNVQITIPGASTITVDVPIAGAFYVRSVGGTVRKLMLPRRLAAPRNLR